MCRVFGSVAREPVSVQHELLEAENPLIRQAEGHDSGWGMAVYPRGDGEEPELSRFPAAAHVGHDFRGVTDRKGRIHSVHVRRATLGGLTLENTHPFCLGNYSFSHNGTILRFSRLLDDGVAQPSGDTDSEHFFNFLMCDYDPGDPVGSLGRAVEAAVERSPLSGMNFIFCDGERLYAYRLGVFELHWLSRPGQVLVASEKLTAEQWHSVQQDVLLVLDPKASDEPHAERLIGDKLLERAEIVNLEEEGSGLRGEERGQFAARWATRLAAGRE